MASTDEGNGTREGRAENAEGIAAAMASEGMPLTTEQQELFRQWVAGELTSPQLVRSIAATGRADL